MAIENDYQNREFRVELNKRQLESWSILEDPKFKYIQFRGGARASKSFALVVWIFTRASEYPGSAHLIARYSRAKAEQTIWMQTILPIAQMFAQHGVCKVIASKLRVDFFNGSYILTEGLEPSRITGVLGAEYGTVMLNECNENKWSVVTQVMTRLNSQAHNAKGERIQPKMVADLNPTSKSSWHYKFFMRKLEPENDKPRIDGSQITSVHFHPKHNIKYQAPGYIQMLEAGAPGFRQRFLDGEYGSFEGLVYNINEDVHVIDTWQPPPEKERRGRMILGRAVDFGFWPDPFCCLWMAHDLVKKRIIIYREWYEYKIMVRDHAHMIYRMSAPDAGIPMANVPTDSEEFYKALKHGKGAKIQNQYAWTVCDHDSEDRATLEYAGIMTSAADKRRRVGLGHMTDLLDFNDHKRPTLYITRDCVNLLTETESYAWLDAEEIKKKDSDMETKGPDHALDCARYGTMKMIPPAPSTGGFKPIIGRMF